MNNHLFSKPHNVKQLSNKRSIEKDVFCYRPLYGNVVYKDVNSFRLLAYKPDKSAVAHIHIMCKL